MDAVILNLSGVLRPRRVSDETIETHTVSPVGPGAGPLPHGLACGCRERLGSHRSHICAEFVHLGPAL